MRKGFNLYSLVTVIIVYIIGFYDAYDNVGHHYNWFRDKIYWFLPLVPFSFLVMALKNKEKKAIILLNSSLIVIYYLIHIAMYYVFKAGASVWRLL